MSFISTVMDDKDSFDFLGYSDGILPLISKDVHGLGLKTSAFCLKSVINLLS